MGMDVSGLKPRSETGEYFRNNVWWWRPLWRYCQEAAPEIADQVQYGQSNDGDGLNDIKSLKLAEILETEIENGNTLIFEKEYEAHLKSLPKIKCDICDGTGKRRPPPTCGAGNNPCNGCDSTGKREHPDSSYPFSKDNVIEFVDFLKDCGGFEIW